MTQTSRDSAVEPVEAVAEESGTSRPGLLDEDVLFHLLTSGRRRRALHYLLDADEEMVIMRDLAEAVAAEEYDTTVAALSSAERQRVYITLYQSHLPQIADADVITYDQNRGHITPTPAIQEFEEHLFKDSSEENETGEETWLWLAFASVGLGALTTLAFLEVFGVFVTFGGIVAVMTALLAIGVGKSLLTP